MPDLKILLTADLNESLSIKNINEAIERIQAKIIKLHVEVDTKALRDAGVILKGLGETAEKQQAKIRTIANATSKLSGEGLNAFKNRVKEIDSIISQHGRQASASYEVDSKGNIEAATIKYIDATNKMVVERMKWQTSVEKVMTGLAEDGSEQFQEIQKKEFKTVGQTYIENTERFHNQISKIYDDAEKKFNLATNSKNIYGVRGKEIAAEYEKIMHALSGEVGNDELTVINAKLKELSLLEAKYKEVETARKAALGTVEKQLSIATASNMPYGENTQSVVNGYQKIIDVMQKAEAESRELSVQEVKHINSELAALEKLELQYKELQSAKMKEASKGEVIASVSKDMFSGANSDKRLKELVAAQFKNDRGQSITTKDVSFSKDIQEATGRYVEYIARIKDADGVTRRVKGSLTEATEAMQKLGYISETTATRNLTMMNKFKLAMQSIPIWMAGMTAFYQTLHFFTDGVKYVNELNKSLTEMSIVLNQSQDAVAHYGEDWHKLGMEMSISTEEIGKGAVEFARQGKTGADMMDSMRQAAIYAKISNIDFNTSAQILTATVNSMGVSAEHATDIFSYMGDATATGKDVPLMQAIA